MSNVMRDDITYIWDAIGIINGTSEDEVLLIGNHRDAWIVGGAADPNSGSAVMIELAKAFGALLQTGWQPRRTIVLCSWDAEEYGLVGSTEWVEEYIPWLSAAAVSYLNIDIACSGPDPTLSATPDLHQIALETMRKVVYPYKNMTNMTMYDVWYGLTNGTVSVLGSGSNYTAFLHNGIASLDVGAENGPNDPVYHYHSNYDTYHWMTNYGDPGFVTHKAMGQYLTLLAYHIANDVILPYNVENYGVEMTKYLLELETVLETAEFTDSASTTLDLKALVNAIETFNVSAAAMTSLIASIDTSSTSDSTSTTASQITLVNTKLRAFSRGFTSSGGLPAREFYKHVVFAPGEDTGYAPTTFPGITEAVIAGNYTQAVEWVGKTAAAIEVAAGVLMP
jgi:N-acetylated-alpha-linked acidic dipeptidase